MRRRAVLRLLATVLIDTVIPKLKGLFALPYAEAMLTQFAFFIAYLLVWPELRSGGRVTRNE